MSKKLTKSEQEMWDILKTPPPPKPKIDPIIVSVVRRVLPQMIAQDIVGVQPMTGPVSEILKIKTRYSDGEQESET